VPESPISPNPSGWHVPQQQLHLDELLECVLAAAKHFEISTTRSALLAGLPLENNRVTPSLLTRLCARASMSGRLAKRTIESIRPGLLPVILLLGDQRACLLVQWLPNGNALVRLPENHDTVVEVARDELQSQYLGIAFFLKPKFRFEARAPENARPTNEHWFWGVVSQNWRLYRDSLLAAFLVNVFALVMPIFSMTVYDRVVPNRAEETLWVLAIGAVLVMIFDMLIRTMRSTILDAAGKRIDVTLSARIMERVLGLGLADRPASVGSFAANLRAFESVRDFIASASITTLVDLPFVLLFLLAILWISPWLILPPVVCIVMLVTVSLVIQRKMEEVVELTQRAAAQRNATLVESLVSIETVKVSVAESTFQRKWEDATRFLAEHGSKLKFLSSATMNIAQMVQQLVSVTSIIVGVYLLINNQISMGAIIAASMLSARALAPFAQVAGLLTQFHQAKSGLASVERHMQTQPERAQNANFLHRSRFDGAIEFKNVTFCYPGQDQTALNGVSFKIAAGEKVGFIGKVGSGKSTLHRLVLGLYRPTGGSILIDGIDSRQIDPAELRSAIGFVSQDVNLFYGTLKENIALGAPFASDDDILRAAEIAGVSDFANRHPRGFDMMIGERGESLSGGQKQSVGIARALINESPMLLLDEPSSAMDHQSEEILKKQLRVYSSEKTLLLVTHRTSLLDLVDRLIVLDQGQIVADGPKAQVVEALQAGRIGRAA
jgi:ATP-binding cassette subfamily C protein LapB